MPIFSVNKEGLLLLNVQQIFLQQIDGAALTEIVFFPKEIGDLVYMFVPACLAVSSSPYQDHTKWREIAT